MESTDRRLSNPFFSLTKMIGNNANDQAGPSSFRFVAESKDSMSAKGKDGDRSKKEMPEQGPTSIGKQGEAAEDRQKGIRKSARFASKGKKGQPPGKKIFSFEEALAHSCNGSKKRKKANDTMHSVIMDIPQGEGNARNENDMVLVTEDSMITTHRVKVIMERYHTYRYVTNADGPDGVVRILCMWNEEEMEASHVVADQNWVGVSFRRIADNKYFVVFGVYLPPRFRERLQSFYHLEDLVSRVEGPVLLIGDFNAMLRNCNKSGSAPSASSCLSFSRFIYACRLKEVEDRNKKFTWSNHRQGQDSVQCKLDWCLINDEWTTSFGREGSLQVQTLPPQAGRFKKDVWRNCIDSFSSIKWNTEDDTKLRIWLETGLNTVNTIGSNSEGMLINIVSASTSQGPKIAGLSYSDDGQMGCAVIINARGRMHEGERAVLERILRFHKDYGGVYVIVSPIKEWVRKTRQQLEGPHGHGLPMVYYGINLGDGLPSA
ncbi:hypothetical protein EJ110_NYTH38345 [Nymphaea thermarum]|nr:hypothetical protein EJ110_NYTH38345 [Nymphaea thermarum]